MSDRPSDIEFKLQHVVIAVQDVAEWFDLGLQLGLPSATLRLIAADPNIKDIKSQRLVMLSEWLKRDTAAGWEKLAAALSTVGENVVADNVRSEFMKIPAKTADDAESNEDSDDDIGLAMKQRIRGQFSSLLDKVQSALQVNQVSVDRVRHFLIRYFRSNAWAKKTSDLGELFDAVSVAKLWNYDHYGPLEEVVTTLLPNDSKLISEYKNQLNAYNTATKITDFIKQSKIEVAEQDPDKPLAVQDFTFKEYRKLKVKLNLKRKVSLSYVDKLWRSLAKEFDLPCLTAVIHSIVMGSLEVTWLVLPHIAEQIIIKDKDLEVTYKYGFYRHNEIVELKIDNDILYHKECPWLVHSTALYQASYMGNIEEVKELLEGGANVNEPNDNKYGETALFGACHGGETECVKVLLKYGAQVDLPDNDGNIALIQACRCGHVETARILLDYGTNIDHQNNRGETPLNLACFEGESETVGLLLKAGAKTDIQEKDGTTALWWAAEKSYANIVKMLVDYGAALDIRDEDGETGLMKASMYGYTETVRVLLEAKADPNITDEDGETALHRAARENHVDVVKTLVKYDAAVDIRNKEGLTALDIARGGGYQAVCEVLEQYAKQETRTELTEESIYQRLLKMVERTFLKEQVKKKEEQRKKEHHHQREERVTRGEREKTSLWNRLRGRRNRPEQIIGTASASKK